MKYEETIIYTYAIIQINNNLNKINCIYVSIKHLSKSELEKERNISLYLKCNNFFIIFIFRILKIYIISLLSANIYRDYISPRDKYNIFIIYTFENII